MPINRPAFNKADMILINGKIITVNEKNSIVPAVAIKSGKIIAVGTSAGMQRLAGNGTETIDLAGKTAMPGIVESHNHPSSAATRFLEIDCRAPDMKGIKDIQSAVAKRAKEVGKGEWVRGGNYNDSKLAEKRQITCRELDEVAPDNPVILGSDTGHQSVVNSKALGIGGINLDTPDPAGGKIDRDSKGEATGLLYEQAQRLVKDRLPEYTVEQMKQGLKRLWRQYAEWGVTSVHDASGEPTGIRAYQQLLAEGVRSVRLNLMVRETAGPEATLAHMKALGIQSGFGDDWLKIMTLKIMGDGSGAGGTAGVYTPQLRGPKGLGIMTTPAERMDKLVMEAHAAGIRCSIHSIGDRGIDIALDAIEHAQKAYPVSDMRHRLEHNSCATPKQLERIKALGVAPSSSIGYMYGIGDMYAENFGPERCRWLHPHKTMQQMGIIAGGNNDCPVTFYTPFAQMYAAVTRKTMSGQVICSEEAISIAEAIKTYTWNGAYLAKEENIKGSVEPGKLADLIVLDRDILNVPSEDIKDIKVLTTIVDGKIVYSR